MKDKILELFFEPQRWTNAIAKGFDKDIRKDQLYQLTKPETRIAIYKAIKEGRYNIAPPHTALIPKDTPGEFRTVYVNEPTDRILLSIANDLLFELCPDMIHPACKSYQKGIGCGRVVQQVSQIVCQTEGNIRGWKSDLSKYFDTVPLRYIDDVFNKVEERHGKSALITVLREYYHSDIFFDENGELRQSFQSLKQGCAVAAFLADAILYHIDRKLSGIGGFYVRYSDDMLFLGISYKTAMQILEEELNKMEMKLNPKKVEYLTADKWFKFLGFSIKGADISLSSTRIKTFQKEIEQRTIKNRKISPQKAINAVNQYLYKGNGEFSWATQVLPVCNVREDINKLNEFVMDCLRAVITQKNKIGGLGYNANSKNGCIVRGLGKNVTANRQKTSKNIENYYSIGCMQNALTTCKPLYKTLITNI